MWDTWVRSLGQDGEIPWRWERLPIPVFWLGEFHGLSMDSPWGWKKSDRTERLSLHFLLFHPNLNYVFFLAICSSKHTLLSGSKRSFGTFNEDLLACTEEVRLAFLKIHIYLFIWLCLLLVLAWRLYSCGCPTVWNLSSPTRVWTHICRVGRQSLDH